jgi:hypothetical protein
MILSSNDTNVNIIINAAAAVQNTPKYVRRYGILRT